jgi:Ca2+-binding RTX toxin-like protein
MTDGVVQNLIVPSAGNDTLNGGSGNDNLYGSNGNDSMTGGIGNDRFTFDTSPGSFNIDIITDFAHGLDKIILDDDIFTKIGAPGALQAGAFRKGAGVTTAGGADDRIILNTPLARCITTPMGTRQERPLISQRLRVQARKQPLRPQIFLS